jgi:hypothetical protein
MKQEPFTIGCKSGRTAGWILRSPGRTGWLRSRGRANPTAGPIEPPVKVIVLEPGTAVTEPPQSLLTLGLAATIRPAGNVSVNATPVSVTSALGGIELLLGFWMVKLSNVVPFWGTVSGRKSLLMVGGLATDRVADAKPPVPPLVELTEPVVFE